MVETAIVTGMPASVLAVTPAPAAQTAHVSARILAAAAKVRRYSRPRQGDTAAYFEARLLIARLAK